MIDEQKDNYSEIRSGEIPIDWSDVEYDISEGLEDRHTFTTTDLSVARSIALNVGEIVLGNHNQVMYVLNVKKRVL